MQTQKLAGEVREGDAVALRALEVYRAQMSLYRTLTGGIPVTVAVWVLGYRRHSHYAGITRA